MPIWHLIKAGSETVNNPDPDSSRPQNRGLRTQNPKQTRPQPPVERGWADKADSRPPLWDRSLIRQRFRSFGVQRSGVLFPGRRQDRFLLCLVPGNTIV